MSHLAGLIWSFSRAPSVLLVPACVLNNLLELPGESRGECFFSSDVRYDLVMLILMVQD